MPIISMELAHPTKEQKEKLIVELTKKAAEILETDPSGFYFLIKENDIENLGVGGKPLAQFLAEKK